MRSSVRLARVVELDRRDHQPFLVGARGVGRHRARHRAADVVVMAEGLDERHHAIVLTGIEDGHGHAEVGQVADPALRLVHVVVEVDVPGPHRLDGEVAHDGLDEGRVRAPRELPAAPVVDAGPEVARLPDHRRAGGPLDGGLDLRLDRGQRPLHDLEDDGVGLDPRTRRRGAGRRDGARLRPDRWGGGHAGQDQVAERIDVDMLAREHDGRRAELLHDRGPGEAIARPETGAVVHGALDVAASEAHGPRARPGALGAAVASGHGPRGRTFGHADADDPQVDPLDSLAGPARTRTFGAVAVAVALLVGGVEALHGLGGARGVHRAGRQLHASPPTPDRSSGDRRGGAGAAPTPARPRAPARRRPWPRAARGGRSRGRDRAARDAPPRSGRSRS